MKTVNYNGTLLEYKSTHRSLVEYEKMSGKDKVDTYTDSLRLMYCIIKFQAKAMDVKFDLDFDGFIDWLDKNPDALQGFVIEEKTPVLSEAAQEKEGQKKS